jgi:GNAT superfamily N-acetyltransferase
MSSGSAAQEKEAWCAAVLLEWGSVGRLLYVDGQPAGYVTYAPPHLVPRSEAFATTPVSADAVLLMAVRVLPQFAGQGLGRVLVQAAAKDVAHRGVRAIEAFASQSFGPRSGEAACVLPVGFLTAVGFKTVRAHPVHPRLRLDLRSIVSLREDVEQAVERLLDSVRTPAFGQRHPAGRPTH